MEGIFYLVLCGGLIYVVHLLYQTEKSVSKERRELKNEIRDLEIKAVSDDHKWLIASLLYVIKIRANFLKTEKNIEFDQRERHAIVRRLQNKLEIKSSVYDEISSKISKYRGYKPTDKKEFDYYLNCIAEMIFSEQYPTQAELDYLKQTSIDKLSMTTESFTEYINDKFNYSLKEVQEKVNQKESDETSKSKIIDSLNSQTPTYADDIVVRSDDNSFFHKVVSDQITFSKSSNLKDGWNQHPQYPIKIYLIEGTPETISDIPPEKFGLITNDHDFAWSNFLEHFSDDYFFHSQLKMQIPKEHLDKVFVSDYYNASDFRSKEILGNRLERHYWSIINSILLESNTDNESKNMVIYSLRQLNHIYFKLNRHNEGIELMKFVLELGKEKDSYYSLGFNYINIGDNKNGYENLLNCCKMYIEEGENIPDDVLFEFLTTCHILEKKQEAEKFLSPVTNINFEETWSRVHHDLTINTNTDKNQKVALNTLFNLIIELSLEPFRSEKIHRLSAISLRHKIDWKEIGLRKELIALAKDDNKESFIKLQDSSHEVFSSLKVLDIEVKKSILGMIKYFINPIKRNGMLIETSGVEGLILIIFAACAELPCKVEHLEHVFSNDFNRDRFYAFWDLNNPF